MSHANSLPCKNLLDYLRVWGRGEPTNVCIHQDVLARHPRVCKGALWAFVYLVSDQWRQFQGCQTKSPVSVNPHILGKAEL